MAGGLQSDEYLGSASTFTLGRVRRSRGPGVGRWGTSWKPCDAAGGTRRRILFEEQPAIGNHWYIAVTVGPHSAPEFFTRNDIDTLLNHDYEVHFNSDRTGVRLIGPKPEWARPDGGEAGLHPSNIHDNAYSPGSLDFTGDTPILLGPDGPSLGGFVCPVTVTAGRPLETGSTRPRCHDPVRPGAGVGGTRAGHGRSRRGAPRFPRCSPPAVTRTTESSPAQPHPMAPRHVTYRRIGDDNILVEYGEMRLDLALRARAHALHHALEQHRPDGLIDLTPGIRSLQVKVDPGPAAADEAGAAARRARGVAARCAGSRGAQSHRAVAAELG